MTSRERLLAAFRRQPVDRTPLRLWGFDHREHQPEPTYQQLAELVRPHGPDLLLDWVPRISSTGDVRTERTRRSSRHEGFVEEVMTLQTPKGPLVQVCFESLEGKPGYRAKPMLETPEDAERWLSLPWSRPVVDCSGYSAAVAELGDEGVLVAGGFQEAMYTINVLTGSEVWGYWLREQRELLHQLVGEAHRRQMHILKEMLAGGIDGVYGYVGPELCIPPLASPRDFDEFCVRYDKPMHDIIHEAGGMVWVHCHGKMGPVLERFAEEGIDCLNPLEPPPMGDVTVAEARQRTGGRMTTEGGIEVGDMELRTTSEVEQMVSEAVWQSRGQGFILGLSSSLGHLLTLPDRVLSNVEAFCRVGRQEGRRVCGR